MTQQIPVGDLVTSLQDTIAEQQDTIDELTASVARHEKQIAALTAAMRQAGMTVPDLDREE
ncbi:hypothetical protein [Saccharopolyspora griseoalba]|uniref:SlyX protein n=1 Tax=Saccharopolyspora griseoalba TaxID=1431848 RepID=A0ABW2LQZ0_9PSEU